MRWLPFILVMFVCIGAGTREPFFFLGAYLVVVWIAVVLFVRGVRWLIRPAGAGRDSCGWGARRDSRTSGGHGETVRTFNADGTSVVGRARVCPDDRCGHVNPGQARFCAQCGRRLA